MLRTLSSAAGVRFRCSFLVLVALAVLLQLSSTTTASPTASGAAGFDGNILPPAGVARSIVSVATTTCSNIAHCEVCSDITGKCDGCALFYRLSNGYCLEAACKVEGCRDCAAADKTLCETCLPGYRMTNDGRSCTPCGIEHCTSCDSDSTGTCDTCEPGFTFALDSATHQPDRTRCVPHCDIADCAQCSSTDSRVCNVCSNGYLFNPASGKCDGCRTDNCATCGLAPEYCDVCNSGYVAVSGACYPVCTKFANCLVCSANQCLQCAARYSLSLVYKACVPCNLANCEACDYPNRCVACARYYEIDRTDNSCIYSGACAVSRCRSCSSLSPNICVKCEAGYGVTTTGGCIRYSGTGGNGGDSTEPNGADTSFPTFPPMGNGATLQASAWCVLVAAVSLLATVTLLA